MTSSDLRRPIRVLVVCTGNSARSILAEALLRHVGGSDFEVHSAGTEPKGVNPLTLRVLGEAGIDTTGLRSKSVEEYLGQPFDYVITVCDQARQVCPVFPGAGERLHWGYEDPAAVEGTEEERLRAFRRVFTQLSERIRTFVVLVRRTRREAASRPAGAETELLRAVPLFAGMPERVVASVAAVVTPVTFPAGAVLMREGDPGDSFLMIRSGAAVVTLAGTVLSHLGGGDFLGEMSLLDGGPRTATVTATEPIEGLELSRADFLELIETSSSVRLAIIEALTQRVRNTELVTA